MKALFNSFCCHFLSVSIFILLFIYLLLLFSWLLYIYIYISMNKFYNSKNNGISPNFYDPSLTIREMKLMDLTHAKINWALVGPNTCVLLWSLTIMLRECWLISTLFHDIFIIILYLLFYTNPISHIACNCSMIRYALNLSLSKFYEYACHCPCLNVVFDYLDIYFIVFYKMHAE